MGEGNISLSLTKLYLSNWVQGGSHSTVGEKLDHNLKEFNPIFEQGTLSVSLDDLISQLSWIQRMAIQGAGIDLDIFSSGLFGKDDVQRLYQFMLQNKDKVGPEIWAQIEMINEALG